MDRKEFEVIMQVIQEEGIRQELGQMIDQKHAGVQKTWLKKTIWKSIFGVALVSVTAVSAYWLLSKNKEDAPTTTSGQVIVKQNLTEETRQTPKSYKKDNTESSTKDRSDVQGSLGDWQSDIATKTDKTGAGPMTINTGKSEPLEEIKPGSSTPTQVDTGSDEDIEPSSEVDSTDDLEDTQVNEDGSIPADSDTSANTTINIPNSDGQGDTVASDSTLARDAVDQGSDEPIEKKNLKWDFTTGIGYGFVSTGDIRCLTLNNEIGYRFTHRLYASVHGNFGKSYGNGDIVNASFITGGVYMHCSVLKPTWKNQLRISAGPALYTISHTYRGSSNVVNGQIVWDYIFERRRAFGYSIAIEDRYAVTDRIFVGARLYTHQFRNADIVSGANLNFGYKF